MSYTGWQNARKVAVMGAGTMGSGIASHLANLGFDVLLFDLHEKSARDCFERAKRVKPPHLFDSESASRVELCSIQTDLHRISEADWVCEAIVENLDAKRALYETMEAHLRADAMVSTNTSGLEIQLLCEGRSESFRKRFLGTHFFNPPRYLKLIELIPTPDTEPEAFAEMTRFLEDRVGRRVVPAKDTPGFIANRYGMWALYQAIHTAEKLGFSAEITDAIAGPLFGRPGTAVFRLADLIGLDIMEDIAGNLLERCADDSRIQTLQTPQRVRVLVEHGFVGNKSGHGFYRREGSEFLVFEPTSGVYRPRNEETLPNLKEMMGAPIGDRLRAAFASRSEIGEFARLHLAPTLAYAAELEGIVSHSAQDFDRVMKWGWGWMLGPFELIDAIGWETIEQHAQGAPSSKRKAYYVGDSYYSFDASDYAKELPDERYATVSSLPIAKEGEGWTVRTTRDTGYIFEFRTKANAVTTAVLEALTDWTQAHPDDPITLANDASTFSVGFDLNYFLRASEEKRFAEVDGVLKKLQACGAALAMARSCASVRGFVLGAGFELSAHCSVIVAQSECTIGLPEVQVGLIPAGGGTTLMRERTVPDLHSFVAMAVSLATGQRLSMADAKTAHYLRATDRSLINPDQALFTALHTERSECQELPWMQANPAASGMIDQKLQELRKKGTLTSYGFELAEEVRRIFVKPKSRSESLEMEREAFLRMLGKPMTQDRIKHVLETGKPLPN